MVGFLATLPQFSSRLPLLGSPVTKRKREKRTVENEDFTKFAGRIIRALSRRVGQGDIDALNDLRQLRELLDEATQQAVNGLRTPDHQGHAYSWEDIGRRLGISKQAAFKNWRGDACAHPLRADTGNALDAGGSDGDC